MVFVDILGLSFGCIEVTRSFQMEWDDELAVIAQRWADQCQFGHDSNRDTSRFQVGQNAFLSFGTNEAPVDWVKAITAWYDEVSLFNGRTVGNYR